MKGLANLGIAMLLLLTAGLVWFAFQAHGTPSERTAFRETERLQFQVRAMAAAMTAEKNAGRPLPESEEAARKLAKTQGWLGDPPPEPLSYRRIGSDRYEVCADFPMNSELFTRLGGELLRPDLTFNVGRNCFELGAFDDLRG